jgi:RecB family endonuclease NucS
MSLSLDLWQIKNENLLPMNRIKLDLEKRLEAWIKEDISLPGIDALIIGQQVHTSYGGFIDLLAINSEGELIIIELKRSKTPRDIVAQCLDYGTWVYNLNRDEIMDIYNSYKSSDLEKDMQVMVLLKKKLYL